MTEKYKQQLVELAAELVTPGRFGAVALQGAFEFEQLQLPEAVLEAPVSPSVFVPDLPPMRRPFRPLPPDTEHTLERLERLGRLR